MKNNPFADLRTQLGMPAPAPDNDAKPPRTTGPGTQDPTSVKQAAQPPRTSGPRTQDPITFSIPRAVVRMERAGRGGKEATVVEQLGLSPTDLGVWLKALKNHLGCGGSVEGANLMLQGDHRTRLPALLTQRGVRKVIVG